ncbi:MAG: MFS transporter [Hyphomicrobiaceae bacterium]
MAARCHRRTCAALQAERVYAIGVHAIGGFLAQVFALIFASYLLSHTGWRTTLKIMALSALAIGIVFIFFVARIPRINTARQAKLDIGEIGWLWTRASGVRLLGFFAAYNMGFFAILTMTPESDKPTKYSMSKPNSINATTASSPGGCLATQQ